RRTGPPPRRPRRRRPSRHRARTGRRRREGRPNPPFPLFLVPKLRLGTHFRETPFRASATPHVLSGTGNGVSRRAVPKRSLGTRAAVLLPFPFRPPRLP